MTRKGTTQSPEDYYSLARPWKEKEKKRPVRVLLTTHKTTTHWPGPLEAAHKRTATVLPFSVQNISFYCGI